MGGRGNSSATSKSNGKTETRISASISLEDNSPVSSLAKGIANGNSDLSPDLDLHAELLGVSRTEAKEIMGNIEQWSKDEGALSYKAIRNAQGTGKGSKETIKASQNIEKYVQKAPVYQGDTFRGISIDEKTFKTISKGKEFNVNDSKTASWSSDISVAAHFAYNAKTKGVPVVFIDNGKKKKTASVSHLSLAKNEKEIISSKQNKFTVNKIQKQKWDSEFGEVNGYFIYVHQR